MVAIRIKKGLDIPIAGKPSGEIKPLILSGESSSFGNPLERPPLFALNLTSFSDNRLSLLVKPGDTVKRGDPLVEDRSLPGRFFVSPAGGTVHEIQRGHKRALQNIVILQNASEEVKKFPPLDPLSATQTQIIERWMEGGGFTHIRKRPFNLLASPSQLPRTIFVKAIESLPFHPPAELQVQGYETLFQAGLNGLKKMTEGSIHLVYRKGTSSKAFLNAQNVSHHTAEGPHPISNYSLHLQEIDPLRSSQDVIWTLNVHDVIVLGSLLYNGEYFVDRIIGIGGPACLPHHTGFFRVREGQPIDSLISGRLTAQNGFRIVSGDPLVGTEASASDFLGFDDYAVALIPDEDSRKLLHFFRLGDDYTASHAYLSGFVDKTEPFDFTTSQHGERRFFIDSSLYDKVMPLHIPTMHLVKAVLAQDYDLADELGLLHVAPEDFTLPTFVDMSKIPMDAIIEQGQKALAKELLL